MIRERERERAPEAVLYERGMAYTRRERDRSLAGQVVVRKKDLHWDALIDGRVAPYLRAARAFGEAVATVLDDWNVYVREFTGRSKKTRHYGGLVLFVIAGKGYSIVDEERRDWQAGDLIVLPHHPGGVEFEHVCEDDDQTVQWLVWANQSAVEWGGSSPLLDTPDARQTSRGSHAGRPGGRSVGTGFVERLHQYAENTAARAQRGKVVVRGGAEPWGQNRQAFIKRYLFTPWVVGEPAETPSDDWRVFVQDIRVHSGSHRHQGGLLIYVLEGEGYSVVEGERHDWEAGNLLLLPLKPGGVEHQHFNKHPDKPAKWIAFINSPQFSWGASDMVQVKQHPEWKDQAVGKSPTGSAQEDRFPEPATRAPTVCPRVGEV